MKILAIQWRNSHIPQGNSKDLIDWTYNSTETNLTKN